MRELGRLAFLFPNNRDNLRSLQSDEGRDREPNHKENEDRESDSEDPNDVLGTLTASDGKRTHLVFPGCPFGDSNP